MNKEKLARVKKHIEDQVEILQAGLDKDMGARPGKDLSQIKRGLTRLHEYNEMLFIMNHLEDMYELSLERIYLVFKESDKLEAANNVD